MSSVLNNQACTTVQRVQWYKNHEATIPEKHFQCDGATLDSPPPPLATDREPRGLPAASLLPRSSPEKFPEQYERAESEREKERERGELRPPPLFGRFILLCHYSSCGSRGEEKGGN